MLLKKIFDYHIPAYLTDRGIEIFKEVCLDFIHRGILHRADLAHIGAYASTLARYEEVQTELLKEEIGINDPNDKPIINPKVKLSNQLLVVLNQTAQKLGITPYGRGVSKRETKPKDESSAGSILSAVA